MSASPGRPSYVVRLRPREAPEEPPPPGQGPVILAALAIGITLMAVQLWLLTVALELYLSGSGAEVWRLALVSGLIFVGGLLMLWLLARRPTLRRLV